MESFFTFLGANPYILLFFTVGMAVWVGKFSVKGYGLGMVAAAVVVGAALATWASTYGVKLQLDNFAKSLMYYLFMYGVGLRVGPSFFNALKKDGITFTILAVICACLGLFLVVLMSGIFDLPAGAAGGILAGSQTMSAAIGTAETITYMRKLDVKEIHGYVAAQGIKLIKNSTLAKSKASSTH